MKTKMLDICSVCQIKYKLYNSNDILSKQRVFKRILGCLTCPAVLLLLSRCFILLFKGILIICIPIAPPGWLSIQWGSPVQGCYIACYREENISFALRTQRLIYIQYTQCSCITYIHSRSCLHMSLISPYLNE